MAAVFGSRLQQFTALALLAVVTYGNYAITTPRKWSSGETVQICLFVVSSASTNNSVNVTLETHSDNPETIASRVINIPPDKTEHCDKFTLPSLAIRRGRLRLSGHIGDQRVSHHKKIKIAGEVTKTFVQTDKYLYKPGQEVQFRILTLSGPLLKVSTNQYPLVWVETPLGSRIAQWVEVDNPSGLIHLSFKLSDEPEKGTYKIHVDSPDGGASVIQNFKVEEYVLPRFDVSVTPPKFILGDDEDYTFNVCAKYTYGQPVKGNVTLKVYNRGWHSAVSREFKDRIMGCKDIRVTAEDMRLNNPQYRPVQSLVVTAYVTEDGTGEEFTGSTTAKIHRTALKFKLVGDEKYIKPGLPYTAKVKVEFPDGSPAPEEPMKVCSAGACKNISSDSAGILSFIIAKYEDQQIHVQSLRHVSSSGISDEDEPAFGDSMLRISFRHPRWQHTIFQSEFGHHLMRYYSPSNSSLVIHSPTTTLPCTSGAPSTHSLPVLYAATGQTSAKITVQVISRGQIQFTSTEEYQLTSTPLPLDGTPLSPLPPPPPDTVQGSLSIPLTLPPSASPTAKVIVWYSREDGEVVSDVRKLNVETCYTNPVTLDWSSRRAHPGDEVDIKLASEPLSVCSLGVVDKSVELLSAATDTLTESGIFGLATTAMVEEWENRQVDDSKYCKHYFETHGEDEPTGPAEMRHHMHFIYNSDYVDSLKMFDDSGLYIFTDLTVETRPCKKGIPGWSARSAVGHGRSRGIVPYSGMIASEYAVGGVMEVHTTHTSIDRTDTSVDQTHTSIDSNVRSYFPETWLWKLIIPGENGVRSESVTLPHTITEWVGKAVCVHPSKGLGVSQRTPIITFTPFFIDLTLPPSVKRGEILDIKISVFNYLDANLPVKVVLEPSSEYEILDEPHVITSPVEAEGAEGIDITTSLGVGQRRSCVLAQDKFVHTVKVRPTAIGDVNITVWAEVDSFYPDVCGPEYVVSRRDHLVKPIKVDIEGFPKEKTWTKYMCSKDIEENADYFEKWHIEAPSDIVPDSSRGWVTAVGDLLGPTLENLGSLVRMPYGCGEQNMLNFAPNIFILQYLEATHQTTPNIAEKAIEYMKQGYQRELQYRHSVGSYSAFGSSDASGSTWLTAFVLKSFAQARQFIQIDIQDINMSREWLRMQQMENGCFRSVGKVLHKGMKGGIDSEGSPVPLTAYVLMSLLESGEPFTSRTVSEAAFCLVADKTQDPYTLALKSYALALADAPEAKPMLQQLIALATETTSSMFWPLTATSGNSDAVAVEAAGYAILAMTTVDAEFYSVSARKVVKWISSQRNGQGGFISTQDTVVALQALASFEAHQHKANGTDLVVMVEAGTLEHDFHIDETNKLLQQSVPLPPTPTNVILDMVGSGCALIQAVLRYNIPADPPSEAFALSVETRTVHDPLCMTKAIKVCASYQLPDQKSNMAVIEINLVSGYIPKKEDLKRIVGYGTGLFKRYEVDGSQVTIYVDEFSPRETCVDFGITRMVDVEDVKPGTVKVYDYYQPEYLSTQSYTLPPVDECLTGPEPEIVIDGIIVDPVYVDEDEEEGAARPGDSIDPAAVDELLDILEEMP